jgi:phosphoserine aminotransferase
MSSDIMSKKFDSTPFKLIYAGAQKNMGPAGTVMYAIDKEALGKTGRNIPSYLDLGVHLSKDSMFNTPPVFSIFTTLLTLRWLKNLGGIDVIEARNNAKAELIYEEIDRNELFTGYAETNSRSTMNATFQLLDDNHKEKFNTALTEAGVSGINGHRSIGGYRASMYNALPLESVKVLVDVMKEFERTI